MLDPALPHISGNKTCSIFTESTRWNLMPRLSRATNPWPGNQLAEWHNYRIIIVSIYRAPAAYGNRP